MARAAGFFVSIAVRKGSASHIFAGLDDDRSGALFTWGADFRYAAPTISPAAAHFQSSGPSAAATPLQPGYASSETASDAVSNPRTTDAAVSSNRGGGGGGRGVGELPDLRGGRHSGQLGCGDPYGRLSPVRCALHLSAKRRSAHASWCLPLLLIVTTLRSSPDAKIIHVRV